MAQNQSINIIPDESIKSVHVSQGDIGRRLVFNLFEGSTEYYPRDGAVVRIRGTKPSGYGYSVICDLSGNVVNVDTTEGMTDEYGQILSELQITIGETILGSANFILSVEKNPHPDGVTDASVETAIQIETRMDAIETRMDAVEDAIGALETGDVPDVNVERAERILADANLQGAINAVNSDLESLEITVSELDAIGISVENEALMIAPGESSVAPPLLASTVSDMTDTTKIYVYVGSETGYTYGNWYYYDGSAWVSGGVYNAAAIADGSITTAKLADGAVTAAKLGSDVTDTTLSVSGMPADAKVVGDEISDLKTDLSVTNKTLTVRASTLENGVYNSSGNKVNSSTRIRTINKIRINRGARIEFTQGTNINGWCYVSYDSTGSKYFASGWFTTSQTIKVASESGSIALMFKKDDSTSIVADDYDATTKIMQENDYELTYDLEGGTWSSSTSNRFDYHYHDSMRRNKYPLIIRGNKMVMLPVGTGAIIFCDADGAVLESCPLSLNGNAFFDVPSNAEYMDITMTQTTSQVTVNIFGTYAPYFSKRIYRNSGDTIVQDIDIEPNLYTNISYKLPVNYSASGDPVPLVLWIAGNNGYSQMHVGFPASTVTGLGYLRDEGYAILQVFSWGSYYYGKYPNCGKDQPYPIPICLRCLKMGIENFIDRYNIDKNNIHVIGRSFGGQMALHYALHPFSGLKSVTMFDPVIDFLSMRGRFSDARKALAEELSLNGDLDDFYDINEDGSTATGVDNYYFSDRCMEIWAQNMPDVIRLNVAWDNLTEGTLNEHYADSIADARNWWNNGKYTVEDIYDNDNYHVTSKIPVKMVYALDDASTPTQAMQEKIAQLRNGGNPTEEYTVPSGGHDAVSVSTTYAQTITTSLGIVCENVQIGWIEAMKWARKNS